MSLSSSVCITGVLDRIKNNTSALSRFEELTRDTTRNKVDRMRDELVARDPHEVEFHQAINEMIESLSPVFDQVPALIKVFKSLAEPERVIMFKIPWIDDQGHSRINRGYRVQFSSVRGPYKGGLRFHPSVNLSIIKFLGFEQTFKNALTSLPLGGGKGGSDFDPRDASDKEILNFCQSMMSELWRHIGSRKDIPAGDIGVGGREIGYLYGAYKKIANEFVGVLTGKGAGWGGSEIRPEATGYGVAYFAHHVLTDLLKREFSGLRCCISGFGNVAIYLAEKIIELGGIPVSFSDSSGTLHAPGGFSRDQILIMKKAKFESRKRLAVIDKLISDDGKAMTYLPKSRPWHIACDLAFPCATQNELDDNDAMNLIKNKCVAVIEGANMPTTATARALLKKHGVILGPAKAANAGGVAVSGLEMTQNYQGVIWTREKVDEELGFIIKNIYAQVASAATTFSDSKDLETGANIASFLQVAAAFIELGQ